MRSSSPFVACGLLFVLSIFGCAQGGPITPGTDAGTTPTMDAGAGLCRGGQVECADKCVDLRSDVSHCGRCAMACATGELCNGGVCGGSCAPPTGTLCVDRCVDLMTDPEHCGECGLPCGGGKVCFAGECLTDCPPPSEKCAGRCTDTASDAANCGACDRGCATGASCVASECQCPAGQIVCGGACVDPSSSAGFCGASGDCAGPSAGTSCASGEVCVGGICGGSCPAGTVLCGSGASAVCADVTNDPAHCRECGNACPAGPMALAACAASTCGITCTGGFLDCNGTSSDGCEVDPIDDRSHCGDCTTVCPIGQACVGSACVASPEVCNNVSDDDGDGDADCADSDCASDPACASGGPCSGLLNLSASTGIVTDGSPASYMNRMSCSWNITVPGSTAIELDFTAFELESCCDYVTVYEGTSASGTRLGRFNGTDLPTRQVAAGESMFITFETDSSVTRDGFTATYSARTTPLEVCANGVDDDGDAMADCADSDCATLHPACTPIPCSGLDARSAPTGVIQDGSGTGSYGNNADCSWLISVPGSTAIQLDFNDFTLESCCDYVTVYQGSNSSGTRLGRYNGTTIPPRLFAPGESMFVTFTSDYSGTYAGFSADYQARTAPLEICTNGVDEDGDAMVDCADPDCGWDEACTPVPCSGTVTRTAPTGVIQDGSGSSNYGNSMSCAWGIDVPGATSVSLDFSAFELEGCCDYVTVYEGTSASGTELGRYNGTSLPPVLTATGGSMFVTFSTDGSVTRQGFVADYAASF